MNARIGQSLPVGGVLRAHPLAPADQGNQPPLVALHGVRGHGRRWPFLAHRTGYGFDLRGHGHSPYEPPWNLEQHASDVITTAARLGLTAFDLIGISFGAAVALHVALHVPEQVQRLILLDPALAVDPQLALDRSRGAAPAPVFDTPGHARAVRRQFWETASPRTIDEEISAHLALAPSGGWHWRYEPAAVVTAFSEAARPLPDTLPDVPALVVTAAHGSLLTPQTLDTMREHGFRITEIDAGHGMDIEAPEAVADLVTQFLEPTERPTT